MHYLFVLLSLIMMLCCLNSTYLQFRGDCFWNRISHLLLALHNSFLVTERKWMICVSCRIMTSFDLNVALGESKDKDTIYVYCNSYSRILSLKNSPLIISKTYKDFSLVRTIWKPKRSDKYGRTRLTPVKASRSKDSRVVGSNLNMAVIIFFLVVRMFIGVYVTKGK